MPADFVALVEKHNIPYHEKTRGQLFCDGPAREIVQMLEGECHNAHVRIFLNAMVQEVTKSTEFMVRADVGSSPMEFRSPTLVVATGGLSVPKMGATAMGHELALRFGMKVREARPALVPFVLDRTDCERYCGLAGTSTEVKVACGGRPGKNPSSEYIEFRDKMLITHRGLSGPALLQISSYWMQGDPITIDLAPDREVFSTFCDPKTPRTGAEARLALQRVLPNRLAARWLEVHAPQSWTNAAICDLEKLVHAWVLKPVGTEGYAKAEVTAGGVDTDDLWAKTMESRNVPGLFFIGEVVDVTGQLGGFNFQWAWASGACAGRAV